MGIKKTENRLNANIWLWVGSVFAMLLGLSGMALTFFPNLEPTVSRESLQTKEVTVSMVDHHIRRHSGNIYYFRTTEGEMYTISGSCERKELLDNISAGKTITVKWYRPRLSGTLLAEEIYVDEKQVVFYDNDRVLDWKISFSMSLVAIFLGTAGFAAIRYDRKMAGKSRKNGKGSIKRKRKAVKK